MIKFSAIVEKYDQKGEKTGWTYVLIPNETAQNIYPGMKQSFRVKGRINEITIHQAALIPVGSGDFILPLNATIRKTAGIKKGDMVKLELMRDKSAFQFSPEMMACLEDDPDALAGFKKLTGSEQKYFSKWIDSAKTETTKAKRITQMLQAMYRGYRFGEMIRAENDKRG